MLAWIINFSFKDKTYFETLHVKLNIKIISNTNLKVYPYKYRKS